MHTTAQLQVGLRIVSALLILLAVFTVLGFLGTVLTGSFSLLALARTGFTLWLCWSVYTGKVWARLVLALLLLLGGGALLVVAFMGRTDALSLVFGLLQIGFAVSLFALPPVNAYFEYVSLQT